jgi:hypothetical protein
MAGFTLVDLSKIEKDTLRKSVMDTFIMESSIMELIDWETIGQINTTIVRYASLPSVGFRKINGTFTEGDGRLEQAVETISTMGGFSDTDKVIAAVKNTIADARGLQQTMTVKAMAFLLNDKFINGNPEVDVDEFKGLSQRIDDLNAEGFTGQYIDNGGTSGDGILLTSAERHNYIDSLDKAIYAISGHNPDFGLMNGTTLLATRSVLRREGLLDTTKDSFDRVVDKYGSARLIDIGVKADQATEIMPNTETLEDAGAAESTSVYFVKSGIGTDFWGIQTYAMDVDDKGLLQTSPQYRTEVDWPVGFAQANPYSLSRLYAIIPNSST